MKPRRQFSPRVKADIIKRQKGICACGCAESLGDDPRGFHFDHIRELWDGGEDTSDNLQALLIGHHRLKTEQGAKRRAKLKRIADRDGLRLPKMNASQKALARMLEN